MSDQLDSISRKEIELLDKDLIEIYNDYGTKHLKVLKYQNDGYVDELYQDFCPEGSYIEYDVIGLINKVKPYEDIKDRGDRGRTLAPYEYSFNILKSSLDEQGVTSIEVSDKLVYKGVELTIKQVVPHPILGDYFVQYSVKALGDLIPLGD